jgi:ketosteroid isomerase-like protein
LRPIREEDAVIEEQMERYIDGGASAINTGDWEAYGSLFAEDLHMVTPGFPSPTTGRDVRVKLAQGLVNAFPDARVEPLRSFGKGDWACIEVLFTGTHTGPMPGPDGTEIPPTNKPVKFPYCMVVRFEDGLVSELYEYYDQLSLLTQLGLMS